MWCVCSTKDSIVTSSTSSGFSHSVSIDRRSLSSKKVPGRRHLESSLSAYESAESDGEEEIERKEEGAEDNVEALEQSRGGSPSENKKVSKTPKRPNQRPPTSILVSGRTGETPPKDRTDISVEPSKTNIGYVRSARRGRFTVRGDLVRRGDISVFPFQST